MATTVKVMLVEDHDLVREGLKLMLSAEPSVDVVGEAGNAEDALSQLERVTPNVVLMDISLPGMDGIDLTTVLQEKHPSIKVVILTMHVDRHFVARAVSAGAHAYLSKGVTRDELIGTLQAIRDGQVVLPMKQTRQIIQRMDRVATAGVEPELLSPRERQIVGLLCVGDTNKEIAEELFISESTVKSHLHSIYQKLNVANRAEAISIVLQKGIVSRSELSNKH